MGPYEMQCHGTLVNVAENWLRKEKHCRRVIVEPKLRGRYPRVSPEEPDAIGWNKGMSVVVECKASLNDLRHDKQKWTCMVHPDPRRSPCVLHRMKPDERKRFAQMGYSVKEIEKMGLFRYILCPEGLVSLMALHKHAPEHGLLYFDGNQIAIVKEAPRRPHVNLEAEQALRRISSHRRRFRSAI